eukprot:symbB.v1.2.039995.t1/scaffold6922.1/size14591/1
MMSFEDKLDNALFESPHDRSGSPKRQRPSPEGANDEDDALIKKVFGSNLPAKIFAEVKGVVKKFATAIGKLSRAVTRQRKAQQDLGELRDGKYPPGVRPYIPGTFVGLQSPLGLASEDDYVVEVVLPRGITRHEAMAKVHLAAATFYKHVDLELLEDYVKELKAQTDYEAFISEACLPASRHHTALQSLGITLPPGLEAPTRVTKEKALELYMSVVNKLAENKVQQKTEEDKRAFQKQKLKEAIENANPRDLFDQAVRQVLRDSPPASSDSQVDYVMANLGAPVEECVRDDTAGKSKGKGGGGEKTRRSGLLGRMVVHALAEALKQNSSLTNLILVNVNIGDEGAKALAQALEQNSTLTLLNLWKNNIGPEITKALAAALKQNSTLTKLILEDNNIGPEGAKALAEALKQNSSLTSLNLRANNIGPEGVEALAEASKQNSSLTSLNLINNNIGDDEGAKAMEMIEEALKRNRSKQPRD